MADVFDDISSEFLHLYPRGRRLLVVAGADAERSRHTADALAAALTSAGHSVVRAHSDDGEETALRDGIVTPFRSGEDAEAVLIVSGPPALIGETTRGIWNYILWQLSGDEAPHSIASAIVDVTDPQHPTRRFADYCALPASFGA